MDGILGYYIYNKYESFQNNSKKNENSFSPFLIMLIYLMFVFSYIVLYLYLGGSQWVLMTAHDYSLLAKVLYALIPAIFPIFYAIYWFIFNKSEYDTLISEIVTNINKPKIETEI